MKFTTTTTINSHRVQHHKSLSWSSGQIINPASNHLAIRCSDEQHTGLCHV